MEQTVETTPEASIGKPNKPKKKLQTIQLLYIYLWTSITHPNNTQNHLE